MYMFFGVVCFLLTVVLVLKILVNRHGDSAVSRFLTKYHLPMFCIMMVAMILHAFMAGLQGAATVSGILCILVCLLMLAAMFIMKRRHMQWMPVHRVFSVILLAVTLVHIAIA